MKISKEAELEEKIEDFMITVQEVLYEGVYEPSENLHSLLIDLRRDSMDRSK